MYHDENKFLIGSEYNSHNTTDFSRNFSKQQFTVKYRFRSGNVCTWLDHVFSMYWTDLFLHLQTFVKIL